MTVASGCTTVVGPITDQGAEHDAEKATFCEGITWHRLYGLPFYDLRKAFGQTR